MAFDLAHDEEISGSITGACCRQRGNDHRPQNRESKTSGYSHRAHEQALVDSQQLGDGSAVASSLKFYRARYWSGPLPAVFSNS